jgi:hypothetical protein
MEIGGIRNLKHALMSNPSRLGLALALVLCAAAVGFCSSGKKGLSVAGSAGDARVSAASEPQTTAVLVTTHPGEVRGCSFLGRVTGPSSEEGSLNAGLLRQRVAEMGGNVLLLLPVGTGEAWYCEQRARGDARPANPTPKRPVVGFAPTVPATPRT